MCRRPCLPCGPAFDTDTLHPFSVEVRSLSDGVQEEFWKFLNDSTVRVSLSLLLNVVSFIILCHHDGTQPIVSRNMGYPADRFT